jgi:hypothetical protein
MRTFALYRDEGAPQATKWVKILHGPPPSVLRVGRALSDTNTRPESRRRPPSEVQVDPLRIGYHGHRVVSEVTAR